MSDQPSFIPPRPATPQPQIHNRLPEQLSSSDSPPKKFLVLITASPDVPGKLQIAREVSAALSAPLYQGDSLHESSAKAASVGGGLGGARGGDGPNEARYQRMWLSKLTRTGLLFPEESRAATGGFEGFGGSSTLTSTSRRGSTSSVSSESWCSGHDSEGFDASGFNKGVGGSKSQVGHSHMSRPVMDILLSEQDRLLRENPVLMVLTHPKLEEWHKVAIRDSIKGYGIAIVFVPLDDEGDEKLGQQGDGNEDGYQETEDLDLPILRPLDPRTMTSFGDIGMKLEVPRRRWEDMELKVRVDVHADVEHRRDGIIEGVQELVREWS